MLTTHLRPDLLWPAQRCNGSVQFRCRAATICRAANIAPDLVQLERSCLADLSTEELELQLQKHGISIQAKPRTKQQIPPQHADTQRPAAGPQADDHHQQEQQRQKQQHHSQQIDRPKHPQQQQQQQRPPHPQGAEVRTQQQQQQARSRSRRVAAAAARRALLLEQLANARVQARSRIVRLPLRLSIPGRAKSRRYLTVPVDVEGAGFVDFLIDSSGYLSRITPAMRDKLGISPADGVAIVTGSSSSSSGSSTSGSSSGGSSGGGSTGSSGGRGGSGSSSGTSSSGGRAHVRLRQRVKLPKMWLGTAQLPPQQAYVTPLQLPPRQQQQMWPGSSGASGSSMQRVLAAAGTVGGVLGVQVLREFEVDIDFGGNSVALHPAGHVDLGLCDTRGLVEVPLRLTTTGALVVPVSLAGSPPFTGLLDLSAASSMLNWEAAALLGMHCNLDSDEEEGKEGQDTNPDEDSSSSSHAGTGADSVRSQQQRQQQRRRARQRSAIKHVGKFGSLDVMPADEMLQKPSLPRQSSSSSGTGRLQSQAAPLRRAPRKQSPLSSSSSSSSLSAAGYSYTPLPGSSIVQQHQVASNAVRLVLGSSKSGANPPTTSSSTSSSSSGSSSSSSSMPASLSLAPPNRFSVAGLKAVSHLGLSGQPVMIVGWDVWARQRAVLCLKVGKLFLSAAAS